MFHFMFREEKREKSINLVSQSVSLSVLQSTEYSQANLIYWLLKVYMDSRPGQPDTRILFYILGSVAAQTLNRRLTRIMFRLDKTA